MKLEREHVRHVAARARELGDTSVIALCNEAIGDPDGGAADRLAVIVEHSPDLMEWMRVGDRDGYRRPAFDHEAASDLARIAVGNPCDVCEGEGTAPGGDTCELCEGTATNTLSLCERRGEALRAALDEIDVLHEMAGTSRIAKHEVQ
jgi:hypothetical protein